MRTKRIFAVVVALGLVAGNVWPHDIASDVDVETSAEVVAEQDPQPAVADSVTMAADTVKKQNFFKKVGAYFKRSNHFDPSKKIDFGVIGGLGYRCRHRVGGIGTLSHRPQRCDAAAVKRVDIRQCGHVGNDGARREGQQCVSTRTL